MTRGIATLLGFGAVVLWATLALLTTLSGAVLPLQFLAIAFAMSGSLGLVAGWRLPVLGATSYAAPFLSTIFLIGVGLAAKDLLRPPRSAL